MTSTNASTEHTVDLCTHKGLQYLALTGELWSDFVSTVTTRDRVLRRFAYISMAWCKTAVSPLLTHWRYCSLALSPRYVHLPHNAVHQSLWWLDVPDTCIIDISYVLFMCINILTLQYGHNNHDGVSNRHHGCLLNRLFRRRSKKTSKLRVTGLCVGKSRPVTRKMFPFDDVIMNTLGCMNITMRNLTLIVHSRVMWYIYIHPKIYVYIVVYNITWST